jgi:hypothetical protein
LMPHERIGTISPSTLSEERVQNFRKRNVHDVTQIVTQISNNDNEYLVDRNKQLPCHFFTMIMLKSKDPAKCLAQKLC